MERNVNAQGCGFHGALFVVLCTITLIWRDNKPIRLLHIETCIWMKNYHFCLPYWVNYTSMQGYQISVHPAKLLFLRLPVCHSVNTAFPIPFLNHASTISFCAILLNIPSHLPLEASINGIVSLVSPESLSFTGYLRFPVADLVNQAGLFASILKTHPFQ